MTKLISAMILLLLVVTSLHAQGNQSYLYVLEPTAIEGFEINNLTGSLISVGPPTTDANGPVAITTNNPATLLFAANANATVSVYQIAASGALSEISGSPFPTSEDTEPASIAISADGNFAYVASSINLNVGPNSGLMDIFSIDQQTGTLTYASSVPAPAPACGFVVLPNNFYICGGSGVVQAYGVNVGVVTELAATVLASAGPNSMAGNSQFIFIGRTPPESQNGFIDSLAISDGSLSIVAIYDAGLFNPETNLALSQGYLFSNQNTYAINPNGGIVPNNENWRNSPASPLAASPTAPFLFQGSQPQFTNLVYPFLIANDGSLTNSEPPRILAGVPIALTVATGTTIAPSNPAFVFNPTTFNFSPVTGGQTSVAQLGIYSTGSAPLTISDISVTGSAFTEQSNTCGPTLTPGAICYVYISFAPSSVGTFTGTLNLTGNVSGTVPLIGTGVGIQVSTVGAGTVQQVPLGSAFASGTAITLTATPNSGAIFSGWTGGCSGNSPVCNLTLTSNSVITATFASTSPPPVTPTIGISPSSQTISPGATAQYQVTETGWATAPQMTVSCAIPKATCTLSAGDALTVTTTAPSAATVNNVDWQLPFVLGLFALFCLPSRKRKAAFCVAALCALAACGSSPKSAVTTPLPTAGTTAGTYSINLSATSGSQKATVAATLTIN